MKAKTIMMALAATAAAAAIADVVEVKFTVKTENDGKVAKKVISGVYDTTADKHVFWTTATQKNEKGRKVKVNVPYADTYFGLVNDTTVARKIGQNAELIWGDETDPENVLVAGAWGTASSKSGQAAGILAGKPATGTWSAKVNTKKTYDELLKKYDVAQSTNKAETPISNMQGIQAKVEQALKDLEEAEAKIDAANKTITEKEAAITAKDGEIDAANKTIDAANKAIAAANAQYDAATNTLAEVEAERNAANEALAAKADELKTAEAQIATIEEAINSLEDPELPNMISEYLDDTEAEAAALTNDAWKIVQPVEDAFTAYTNTLDVAALEQAVANAQADLDVKTNILANAKDLVEALTLTNNMISVIDDKKLEDYFADKAADIEESISNKVAEIEAAKVSFVAYTNALQIAITNAEHMVDYRTPLAEKAHEAYEEALSTQEVAQVAVDAFNKDDVEVMTYDAFIEAQEVAGVTYDNTVEARKDYDNYVAETQNDAKKVLDDALDVATTNATAKAANDVRMSNYLKTATDLLAEKTAAMEAAKASGKMPEAAELEAELKELEDEKAALNEELAFWKSFQYSDDDRAKFEADLEDANDALVTAEGDVRDAQTKLDEAIDNKENQATDTKAKLQALAYLICGDEDGLYVTDEDGNKTPMDVTTIRAKVDAYRNAPVSSREDGMSLNGMIEAGERMIAAVAKVRAELLDADNAAEAL